jgi:hypothetical protein
MFLFLNDEPAQSSVTYQLSPDETQDMWTTSVYYDGGWDTDYLITGGWSDYYYTFIQMDISSLPGEVASAQLQLYVNSNFSSGNGPHAMYLDRVTSSWDETTKWANNPSYSEIGVIPAPTVDSWYTIDITYLYNGWKSGLYPNYGIQLRPTDIGHSYNSFWSSDYTQDPTLRPKLVMVPTPVPAPALLLFSGLFGVTALRIKQLSMGR